MASEGQYPVSIKATLDVTAFQEGISTITDELNSLKKNFTLFNEFDVFNKLKEEVELLIEEMGDLTETLTNTNSIFKGTEETIEDAKHNVETFKDVIEMTSGEIVKSNDRITQSFVQMSKSIGELTAKQEAELERLSAWYGSVPTTETKYFSEYTHASQNLLNMARNLTYEHERLRGAFAYTAEEQANVTAGMQRYNQVMQELVAGTDVLDQRFYKIASSEAKAFSIYAEESENLLNMAKTIEEFDGVVRNAKGVDELHESLLRLGSGGIPEATRALWKLREGVEEVTFTIETEVDGLTSMEEKLLEVSGVTNTFVSNTGRVVTALEEERMQILAVNEGYERLGTAMQVAGRSSISMTAGEAGLEGLATNAELAGAGVENLGNQSEKAETKVNRLNKAGTLLRRTMILVGVVMGYEVMMGVINASKEMINARESMTKYGELAGWTGTQITNFRNQTDKLQKTYRKIDMSQVGSTVAQLGQQYNLTEKQAQKMIETSAVFTAAMANEGRSTGDAVLALKDYYDQGAGWTRRMQEIGVTEEKLKATGLWSGEKDDIEGMNDALAQVMKNMNLYARAQAITNPEEGWEAIKIQIAEVASQLYEFLSPAVTEAFQIWSNALTQLGETIDWLKNTLSGLPTPIKDLIKHISAVIVAISPFLFLGWQLKGTFEGIGGGLKTISSFTSITSKIKELTYSILGLAAAEEAEAKAGKTVSKKKETDDKTKTPFKESLIEDMKGLARSYVNAAVGLALVMALVTEAIVLIQAPMMALGATGDSFRKDEKNIRSGVDALYTVGPVILALSVALTYFMKTIPNDSINYMSMGKSAVNVAIGIALLSGLISEAIIAMIPPLVSLSAVGLLFPSTHTLEQGVNAIKMLNIALAMMIPEIIAFGVVSALFLELESIPIIGEIGAGAGLTAVATSIAVVSLLMAESIGMMILPLGALAGIGALIPDTNQLKKATEGIKAVNEALSAVAGAMGSVAQISWDRFVIWLTNIFGAGTPELQILNITKSGGTLDAIASFSTAFSNVTIQKIDENKLESLVQVSNALSKVSTIIDDTANISTQRFWDWWNHFWTNLGNAISGNGWANNFTDTDKTMQELGQVVTIINNLKLPKTGDDWSEKIKGLTRISNVLKAVDDAVSKMGDVLHSRNNTVMTGDGLAGALGAVFGTSDLSTSVIDVENTIKDLADLMSRVNKIKITAPNFDEKIKAFQNLSNFLKALEPAITRVKNIVPDINGTENFSVKAGVIGTYVENLAHTMSDVNKVTITTADFTGKTEALRNFIEFLKALEPAINRVKNFPEAVQGFENKVYSNLQGIVSLAKKSSTAQIPSNFPQITPNLRSFIDFLTALQPSVTRITNISNIMSDNFSGMVNRVYSGIQALIEFANKVSTVSYGTLDASALTSFLSDLTTKIKESANNIKDASQQMYDAGKGVGDKLSEGLLSAKSTVGNAGVELISQGIQSVKNRYQTWYSAGRASGVKLAEGVRAGLTNLQKIVTSEIDYAINAARSKKGAFGQVGADLAKEFVNRFKNELDQHSPGKVARMAGAEVGFAVEAVNNGINQMREAGGRLAGAFTDSYQQNINTTTNTPTMDLNNLALLQHQAQTINGITTQTANNTATQFGYLDTTMLDTFNNIGDNAVNTFQQVETQNQNYMGTLNNQTNTGLKNVTKTTQTQLGQMRTSTVSTVTQMTNAWNSMKNNIVSAASQIRTQSYNKFSSLHHSISSFYNQLASAHFTAGIAMGSGSGRLKGIGKYRGNTGGRITTKKHYVNDSYGSGVGTPSMSKNYLSMLDTPNPLLSLYYRALVGCTDDNCYFGTVGNNYQRIKKTVDNYSIADPYFLGIQIPMGNHVYDWEGGKTKRIDASNFEEILRLVLTARGFNNPNTYQYYANSMRSNQQVWDELKCNCYDGAEVIAEIGQMLGLGGSLVHGSWNGEGHMAAMVAGRIYDMTQFQKRGVFRGTPGVVFGPPKNRTVEHKRNKAQVSNNLSEPVESKEINITINGDVYGEESFIEKMKDIAKQIFLEQQGESIFTGQ